MDSKKVLWVAPPVSYGGVSMNRYHTEVVNTLNKSMREYEGDYVIESLNPPIEGLPIKKSKVQRCIDRYIQIPLQCALKRNYDVLHGLAHDAGELFKWAPKGVKRVATVHDIIPLTHPEDLSLAEQKRFRKSIERLEDFDALICVSKYVSGQLKQHMNISDEQLFVAENGVCADTFSCPTEYDLELENQYVFSVSNISSRKNLKILPDVFKLLHEQGNKMYLVRAGALLSDSLKQEWNEKVGAEYLVEFGKCSDEVLVALYQNAETFFFPSTAEGFGLPLLEAYCASCPVASSNMTSLPEVGRDYAHYFAPDDIDGAANSILVAMEDKKYNELLSEAKRYAETMTWEAHVSKFYQCYDKLL